MNLIEALEIACEELDCNVEQLRVSNKGYTSRVEGECNHLLAARNTLLKLIAELQEQE